MTCREEPDWFHSCVHTCNDYQAALNDGWQPKDEMDRKLDSAFAKTCGALEFLSSTQPTRNKPTNIEESLELDHLPASLVIDMLTANNDSSCQPDMSLVACEEAANGALTIKQEGKSVHASAYDLERYLEPVVAKVNQVLIWQATTTTEGKYLSSGYEQILVGH